jgi:hypothetical protein
MAVNKSNFSFIQRLCKVFWIKGRINRFEYTISMILVALIIFPISDYYKGSSPDWLLPVLYPYFTQGAKRCQDRGKPWFIFIFPLNFLWNFSDKSDVGPNIYGDEPIGVFLNQ